MGDTQVPDGRGGALRAYLAEPPTGTGPWPGVVLLHEILGLTRDIRSHADRLAAAGYLAVAPDLYSDGGARRCLVRTVRALNAGAGAAVQDIDTTRQWLAARADCTGRVGVAGFCLGGGFALVMAARGFDAASTSYGPLPRDPAAALAGACPVVGSYGAKDPMMRGAGPELDAVLTELGVEHDVKEYPLVGHSFMNRHPVGPLTALERVVGLGHDDAAAEQAWARILAFFGTHLGR